MAIDCVLLGAGASTRMGEPKLLVSLGEKTVFETALANHLASSIRLVCAVVAGWLPGFAPIVRKNRDERVRFLGMMEPCPMSQSLKSGWSWVESNWKPDAVMISLGDKPLVTSETIDLLIGSYISGGRGILVPTYHGTWGHPVIVSSSLGEEIMHLDGDRGALEVLTAHRDLICEVPVDSDEVVFDVDSSEDIVLLKKRLGLNG